MTVLSYPETYATAGAMPVVGTPREDFWAAGSRRSPWESDMRSSTRGARWSTSPRIALLAEDRSDGGFRPVLFVARKMFFTWFK